MQCIFDACQGPNYAIQGVYATQRSRWFRWKTCTAIGIGNLTLEDQQGRKFSLKDIVHVPDADSSQISFVLARAHGLFVEFTSLHDFILTAPASGLQLSGTSINCILHVKDFETPAISSL